MCLSIRPLLALLLVLGLLSRSTVAGQSQEATPEVDMEQGIVYSEAGGESLQLDVYRPASGEQPRPAVALFPGWDTSRLSLLPHGMELVKAGYVVVAVDYRADVPEYFDDARRAIRWIRAHAAEYDIDPDRICAYGYSGGGDIATMLAVRDIPDDPDPTLTGHSSRVTCAVPLAGISDMTIPYVSASENQWVVEQLGGTPEEVPEAYREASAVTFVDEQSAPVLIIHGNGDGTVPIEHARRLAAALQAADVEVVYAELAGENHSSVAQWEVNGPFTLAFLERHLQPER